MPTLVGLARQNGSSLVSDSTILQLDIDGGKWRQVEENSFGFSSFCRLTLILMFILKGGRTLATKVGLHSCG